MPSVVDAPATNAEALLEQDPEIRAGGPGGGGPPDLERGGGGGGDDDESARRRPGGGPSAGMLGMIATLVSITALFATIVIAFMIRSRTKQYWSPIPIPYWLWISTALIAVSSFTMESARKALAKFDSSAYAWRLVATFLLGVAFIVSQSLGLFDLMQHGFLMRANPHSSLLYIITGAHAAHVAGGMFGLLFLILRAALHTRNVRADHRRTRDFTSVAATYWHFLDGLWVALFLLLVIWK